MQLYIDPLQMEKIQDSLPSFYKIKVFDSLNSTNEWLASHPSEEEGTVILADGQTGGKGRNGRSFYSPRGSGIYLSLLLKPAGDIQSILHYTALCAVSICEAIEEVYGLCPSIKWLNDIHYHEKKLGGILCEGKLQGNQFESLILGMGINVHSFILPDDIVSTAASIEDFIPAKKPRNELITRFLQHFYSYYHDQRPFIQPYKDRLAYVNRKIWICSSHKKELATLLGVDESFRLIVQKEDGAIDVLSSGEISIRL